MEEKLLGLLNVVLHNNGLKRLERLDHETHLRNDLELDSINLAELTVRVEDEFGIDLFEDGIVDTVGQIIEKIKSDK